MKRLVAIDLAKAVCIILVVIGHYNPSDAPEWYSILNKFIYTFHMPLFMFASGYIYAAAGGGEESYSLFIRKKFKRLMLPYFSTSVIVISLKLLTQHHMPVENAVSWHAYIKMFYLPEAGFFLWFIWALWLIFLLVPLIRCRMGKILLFAISLSIGFFHISWPEIFCIGSAIGMLKYFMLGVMLVEYPDLTAIAKKLPAIIPILFFPLLFACSLTFRDFPEILLYLLPYLGIYTVCMLAIQIGKHRNLLTRNLLTVSSSSYIIYLLHTSFEGFVKSILHHCPLLSASDKSIGFSIGAFLVITAGVVFPILIYRYVLSKKNILRFLFGLPPAVKQNVYELH